MGNILFTVPSNLHKRNCTHTYELTRIYIRKSTEPKNEKDEKTGKKTAPAAAQPERMKVVANEPATPARAVTSSNR